MSADGNGQAQAGSPLGDGTQRELERARAEIFALKRSVAERDRKLADMQSSTSWRITAPLRAGVRWLRERRWLGRGARSHANRDASFDIDAREYQDWLRSYSTVDAEMRAALTAAVARLPSRPLISVIMPSYNIDHSVLQAAIDSVREQIYPHWELCISDDASTMPGTRELLESLASENQRIRITFRDTNGHISANSNSALALATGDYVALMDADDLIPPDALFWFAHEIALDPQTDILFSDEDKIDAAGQRFAPYFKSAWNPALMRAQNAFCHLGVFRRSLVERAGRFRESYEGAQDHDLVLRCAALTSPDRIRHIPRILYHWRVGAHSTAAGIDAKPYAANALCRVIEDDLRRNTIKGRVEPAAGSFAQVAYELPEPAPLVSLLVPSTLRGETALRCLRSVLRRTAYPNFEMLLLATEADLSAARERFADVLADPRVRPLPYQAPSFNHSWVNNFGAKAARGTLLCFLNDDVEVIDEAWLAKLAARVSLTGVGAAGPMLYYPSDLIQHAGVLLGVGGVADHAFRNIARGQYGYFGRAALEQDYSCLTAACLLVRRDLFEQAGGFDDALEAFNDVDLCIRMRQTGARLMWTPDAALYHHESLSLGAPDSAKREQRFALDHAMMRERWGAILDRDPCYNPNLSLDREHQFQLAAPPRTSFASREDLSGLGAVPLSRTSALR
jgi:GT2 family glycosyltransferase